MTTTCKYDHSPVCDVIAQLKVQSGSSTPHWLPHNSATLICGSSQLQDAYTVSRDPLISSRNTTRTRQLLLTRLKWAMSSSESPHLQQDARKAEHLYLHLFNAAVTSGCLTAKFFMTLGDTEVLSGVCRWLLGSYGSYGSYLAENCLGAALFLLFQLLLIGWNSSW